MTSAEDAMAYSLLTSLTSWRQNEPDFTVMFPSTSQTLRCHKAVLAKNSPVLKTMLNLECVETSTSQMTMVDFDYETTVRFLSCLYSDCNSKTRRSRARLTPQVLKMAHFYEVKKLQDDCVECLKGNVTKDNVVELWMVAEMIEDESLRDAAFMYFFDHPRDQDFSEIPGMSDACVSGLVDFLLSHADLAKMIELKHMKDTLRTMSSHLLSESVAAFQDWLRGIKTASSPDIGVDLGEMPQIIQEPPTAVQKTIQEPSDTARQMSLVEQGLVDLDEVKSVQ